MTGINIPNSRDYETSGAPPRPTQPVPPTHQPPQLPRPNQPTQGNPVLGCVIIAFVAIGIGSCISSMVAPRMENNNPREVMIAPTTPPNPPVPVRKITPQVTTPRVNVKLNSPTIAVSAMGSHGIRVTWNPVNNASNYVIQRATNSVFTRDVRTGSPTTTTWGDIVGLDPNTTYYIRVMATGSDEYSNSDYSQWRSATTLKLKLGTPEIVHAGWGKKSNSNYWIGLTWTSVRNASYYTVEYTTDSTFRTGVRSVTVGSSTTSREISGLRAYTKYYVRVKATGAGFIDSDYDPGGKWIRTPR